MEQNMGASPDGDRAATPSEPSHAVSGVAGIPSANEALTWLIDAVAAEAQWIADRTAGRHKAGDGEIRRRALELIALANELRPASLYLHQRAAMLVRDFAGNPEDDWHDYVPAAFAALLKTYEIEQEA